MALPTVVFEVLAREGSFDAEVVNFEFRRQCLQVGEWPSQVPRGCRLQ